MKTIFYTTDTNLESVYSSFEDDNAVLCSDFNDLGRLVNESDVCTIVMDFDCAELDCLETHKSLVDLDKVFTILLTGSMELPEILKIQNSSNACDAYLTKPVTKEIILDVIGDFQLSVDQSNSSDTVAPQMEQSLVFSARDLESELDQSVEDDLLASSQIAETEETEDEDDQVDFNASEFRISDEVRDVVDQHNQSDLDFDDEVNKDIQRKFDSVFGKKKVVETSKSDIAEIITPIEQEKEEISFEKNNTQENIDFNPEEDNIVVEESPSIEVTMSDDNEEVGGLEFSLPDEEVELAGEEAVAKIEENDSEDVGELDFSVSDDSQEESEQEEGLSFDVSGDDLDLSGEDQGSEGASEDSSDDGLEFDVSEDSLSLSDETDTAQSAAPSEAADDEQEGGLEFDMDSDDSLSLSADGDEVESAPLESAVDDGLDFNDDSDEGLSLSAEGDEIDNSVADEGGAGDIDFSATEDDGEGVDHASIESTDSFQLGDSDDLDATINSIVAPPAEEDQEVSASAEAEDSTGEFDMAAIQNAAVEEDDSEQMQEFDYKTSSGFSPDLLDSVGDNTNPTIIASTGSLKEGDLLSDLDDSGTVTEENVVGELSFSETIEDDFSSGLDELMSANSEDNNLTQTVQTSENSNTEPAPRMSSKEEYENFRSYDEDEMLRLQGTIRQLREEREELMSEITQLKAEKQILDQDNLGLKAELDEVKIELGIIKKRHHEELSEKEYQNKLNEEKRELYELKAKNLQKEFDRLNQKVRLDFNQVKQREKELESKLELTVMDSESLVQTRDMKILDLKRKIDALEFNMENSTIRELKHREDKSKLEERLGKIMKTLRGSIQLIEDDLDELEEDNTKELD
ncbi:hypothetical protein [Halobacteriovorax sp. HLS]|uniref:hypothetical protein n=1 Tax=Halobacteriovorax sp. HLS TaxID=2234000 RepID=UPI000FDA2345|nr:hypothetical protein [Halobacteriovorax sp. HLS]